MDHRFPPLLSREDLRGPVVCVVAHPDDEVIGCGGMLAYHAARGDRVTVLHLTDGAGGDPEGRFGDEFAAVRRAEAEAALGELGVHELRGFGFPDGQLPESLEDAIPILRSELAALEPRTLYSFFFLEAHRDHRAVGEALVASADVLSSDCRCLLFGVNHVVPAGTMFDVTDQRDAKQRALHAFRSQIAYNAFVPKVAGRDFSNTVNIEDEAVLATEVFADLPPSRLARARDVSRSLHDLILGRV
jgi:LmbE family N-acetylglucosaminyl deacetylase